MLAPLNQCSLVKNTRSSGLQVLEGRCFPRRKAYGGHVQRPRSPYLVLSSILAFPKGEIAFGTKEIQAGSLCYLESCHVPGPFRAQLL